MSWLAIGTGRRVLRVPQAIDFAPDTLVATGSLVLEAAFQATSHKPQVLIDFNRFEGWLRRFRVTLRDDGEMFVEHVQRCDVTCALLSLTKPDRGDMLRMTYSWIAPARQGLLSVENLDNGCLDQVVFDDPKPWLIDDIAALISDKGACTTDATVALLAVSDHIEAVGLPPGLAADAIVDTAAGPRAVGRLERGDLVMTADRGWQPVRWTIRRELPAAGRFAPVRLRAPFFGLDCDLDVAPDHRVQMEGADSEYLFGADAVLVEARHLSGLSGSARPCGGPTVTYVHLILDRHSCFSASGAWIESLYLGEGLDHPTQLGGAGLTQIPPHRLPLHTQVASPLLKPYEAVVLMSALYA